MGLLPFVYFGQFFSVFSDFSALSSSDHIYSSISVSFSAFSLIFRRFSLSDHCSSSNLVVMSKRLAENSEASDEMSDECQDSPNFEPGTIVLLCNLPENLKASNNTEATVIHIVKKTFGKCEKVMVQAVIHGVSQRLRLPINCVKLPPLIRPPPIPPIVAPSVTSQSTLSRLYNGFAAGMDAALQLFSRAVVVQPPVEDVADEEEVTAPGFQFRLVKPPKAVRSDDQLVDQDDTDPYSEYMKSLTEWKVALYYKGTMARDTTIFGPFEVLDMKNQLSQAAARCGFGLTDQFGHRESAASCSFSMGCSCGRLRSDNVEAKPFVKDLHLIVASAAIKTKKIRPGRFGGGYMRATTQRTRSKYCQCHCLFNFTSVNVDEHGLFTWKFNTRRGCSNSTQHTGHPRTPIALMTHEVVTVIRGLADNFTVPSILTLIREQFKVPFTRSQIRYAAQKNTIALEGHRQIAHSGGGGVEQVLNFLARTKAACLLLLQALDGVDAGKMFMYDSKELLVTRLSDYDMKKPVLEQDPSRVFSWQGKNYFVLCLAWNWITEAQTFHAFPEVCVIDCQHGVTNTTDGMNCIGIDGNMHNISALRVFIYSQSQEVFRWVLCVAFPHIVLNFDKIKVFFSDDDQHMGPVLKGLVGPGKLFPLAKYFKCAWHLIRHNVEDTFGKGNVENPWQQRLISALSRVRKSESVAEFDATTLWMWCIVRGMEDLGEPRSKLRLKVAAFITKRLEMSDSWVLFHQLLLPTRGGSTTQRVESDHCTSREAGVDARNSWLLTARRMHAILDKRRVVKREWCDRQIGSSLIRGPTVSSSNNVPTLTPSTLKTLDAAYLPWSIETFEEQLLLSSVCDIRFVGKGELVNGFSSVKFVVWCSNPHYGAGSDSEEDDADSIEGDASDHDPDNNDDVAAVNMAAMSDTELDAKRQKHDKDDANSVDYPELELPALPASTRFHWLRLRTVHVFMVDGTDNMAFRCSCGFFSRIGTACRHVLRALRFILETVAKACVDPDEATVAPPILAHVDFSGFFKLDWCSKIRYHSIIFNNPLPPDDCIIYDCYIHNLTLLPHFVQQAEAQHLKTATIMIDNGCKVYEGIPKEGLPDDCRYEFKPHDDSDNSGGEHDDGPVGKEGEKLGGPSGRSLRFTPTNANAEHMLQKMLKSVGKNTAARAYLGAQMIAMQAEIARIVQPKVNPQDLRRHFSKSDLANGRPRPLQRK